MTITQKLTTFVAAFALVAAMVMTLAAPVAHAALTESQIQSILSLLSSFGADQATIDNVNASLRGQTPSGGTSGGSSASCSQFTRDLTLGSTGADVQSLQVILNANGAQVAASGAGSPGSESTYFGALSQAALAKWQAAHGVSPAAGYFGPITRAALASSGACGATSGGTTGGTTPAPTGTGLSVSAGSQPQNALAPQGARVPFTKFTLTAGTDGAVTVNGVVVQRAGLGSDASFSGVVLIDDATGAQIGTSKTFNSNHQATIGETMTIPAGSSKAFTVAGIMAASLASYAGEAPALSVIAINSPATVSGSLPISGAFHTINATLSVGSVSTSTSSFDPGANQNKDIGDTDVRVSGIRFTANSSEDMKLHSIRWRQVGTASAVDISNVRTLIDGTAYPTTVSADGKYYTSTFPAGILVGKGNSIDAYVQVDITGTNSAARTVAFDIDRNSDVYFVGQLYGYGILPSGTYTPWFDSYTTTINAGSATTISNATEVPAQNIAPGVNNQPLGGFITNFSGEQVSFTQIVVNYATTSAAVGLITSASIVDENGTVVAGPVDATYFGSASKAKFTFSDTVTFPTGRHVYTLRGKVPASAGNNATIQLDTTPSGWSNPTGQTSGNSITISQANFTMNIMTVKAGALAVSLASTPVAQNIIAGTQGFTFANLVLDVSQSGEDVRLNSVPFTISSGETFAGAPNNLSTCQLWDGSTPLNGGTNVVNPSGTATTSDSTATFTFTNSLVISKGVTKTLALKCNLSSSAHSASQYTWEITGTQMTAIAALGVTSGAAITETDGDGSGQTTDTGQTMTVASTGTLTATAASTAVSQPALNLIAAGTNGVTIGNALFTATNENIRVSKIGFTLANGTYGSGNKGATGNSGHTANDDVTTAYIYDGSTLLGSVNFTGNTATSTLDQLFTVPSGQSKTLTIRADIAGIGTTEAGGVGDTVKVDVLNAQGTGVDSSQQVNISATAGVNGVQIFKSVPTVALGTGACTGTGCNGTNQVLKVIKVTAGSAGDISVNQLKFDIATSSATLDAANVSVLDGSGNTASSTFGAQIAGTAMASAPTLTYKGGPVIIPAGQAYTFRLTGTVTPGSTATNWSVNVILQGDSAAIAGIGSSPAHIATTTTVATGDAQSGFIWAAKATTTAPGLSDVLWTNGFQVSGLPSIGL